MNSAKLKVNLICLLLTAAAFLGNYYVVELFFGVDFLLGSIFWLVLLRSCSARKGVLVAVLASALTIRLWNHPYGMLIFSLEALVIAVILQRRPQTNLVAAGGLYWFLLAPLLVYVTYGRILELSTLETAMIYFKQSVNGLFNVTLASLLVNHVGLLTLRSSQGGTKQPVSLRETLFTLTIAVILLPALVLTVSNSRARINEMETAAAERLSTAASVAVHAVVDRYGELQSVLAQHGAQVGGSEAFIQSLQTLRSFRQYLQLEAAIHWPEGEGPELVRFDGSTAESVELSPAEVGAAHGWLPVEIPLAGDGSLQTAVVFVNERALVSLNLDSVLPQDISVSFLTEPTATAATGQLSLEHTAAASAVKIHKWGESHYVLQQSIPGTPQWHVQAEMPIRPHRDSLYTMYVFNFGIALGLTLLALLIAAALSRWMVQPLLRLSSITTGVAQQGDLTESQQWPSSPIHEMNQLSHNLAAMVQQLQKSIEQVDHARAEYQHLATHDGLTGLPNRRACGALLKEALAADADGKRQRVGVLFFDLDAFKPINDTMGHQVGDEVLQAVAARLVKVLGAKGTLCRYGGDEFAVVVPAAGSRQHLQRLANRILQALAEPLPVGQHELLVTASIGISMSPRDGRDAEILLKKADIAMYQAKLMGKNQWHFFESHMLPQGAARLFIGSELATAIKENQLELHYQPIVDLHTEEPIAMEVLVRWRHPQWGLIMPDEFIPLAEDNGQIVEVGEWVLRHGARQMVAWNRLGLEPLCLSVNVSRRQLQDTRFVRTVQQILSDTGLPPRQLQLEVTETTVMQNQTMVSEILRRLMQLGVATAMDDFGTGQSSLASLRQLPLNTLKVDRAFVTDLQHRSKDALLIRAATALGKSLGLKVTAEGVEDAEQRLVLLDLGCDSAQGYYFAKPMAAEAAWSWLQNHATVFENAGR